MSSTDPPGPLDPFDAIAARLDDDPDMPATAWLASALAGMHESMAIILEGVTRYRDECLASGYSETAAESMAIDAHHAYVYVIFMRKPDTTDDETNDA